VCVGGTHREHGRHLVGHGQHAGQRQACGAGAARRVSGHQVSQWWRSCWWQDRDAQDHDSCRALMVAPHHAAVPPMRISRQCVEWGGGVRQRGTSAAEHSPKPSSVIWCLKNTSASESAVAQSQQSRVSRCCEGMNALSRGWATRVQHGKHTRVGTEGGGSAHERVQWGGGNSKPGCRRAMARVSEVTDDEGVNPSGQTVSRQAAQGSARARGWWQGQGGAGQGAGNREMRARARWLDKQGLLCSQKT
jgi:hypothetical protein